MIKIYNENRLTRQPFFKAVIEYLYSKELRGEEVTLRQIHKDFADVKNIDRQMDSFIAAGLIERADKRYTLGLPVLTDADFSLTELSVTPTNHVYTAPFLVATDSKVVEQLDASVTFQVLTNSTNAIALHFSSRYDRTTDTLANYFYKVAENLPLTTLENEVYQLMGDVDPEYALKYMTTFLLKFMRKDIVKTKKDIFITVLEKYGYIASINDREYRSLLEFDEVETLPVVEHTDAKSFVAAQIQQKMFIKNYISIN